MSDTKTCTKCHQLKAVENFQKDSKRKSGLQPWCKSCISIANKNYHKNHTERRKNIRRKWYEKNVTRTNLLDQTPEKSFKIKKNSALHRKINFDLTFEDFMTLWQKPCSYCGVSITSIGIDRLDSLKDYTISNCVPCCLRCNTAKMDLTKEEFIDWIKRVYENLF